MKKVITIILAAALVLSVSASLSGCTLGEQSPADTYSSPLRSKESSDEARKELENSGKYTEKNYGTDKNSSDSDTSIVSDIISKLTSMTESKTEKETESKSEKKAENKTEKETESKSEKKAESKTEEKTESKSEKKAESKTEEDTNSEVEEEIDSINEEDDNSKKENKEDDSSPLYKDIMNLIKDDDTIVGYAICSIVGSADEHLIIEYGGIGSEEKNDGVSGITDMEAYAREQEAKAAAREEDIEQSKLYSVYRVDSERVIPEGDLSGYYTTAYISSNTGTLGMYYTKDTVWKFGLVELDGNSAFINYSNEGTLEETGSFPSLPGDMVGFSQPGSYDIFAKYK